MALRVTLTGVGDLRRKLASVMDAAKADEHVGHALKAGAQVFGDAIAAAVPVGLKKRQTKNKGRIIDRMRNAVKKAQKGRQSVHGPVYFSAIDRKKAPHARFLHLGTKHQTARPEVLGGAVRSARAEARRVVMARLLRIAWDNL
jgi:HK97 gp10 family phage protein